MFLLFVLFAIAVSDPIPAADLCNVGFDFRNGTFKPGLQAKALEIFSFNYDKGKTWKSPEHPEIVWEVPDEVEVSTRTSSWFSSYEGYFMHFSQVITIRITSWHIGGGFSYDNFGVNADYSQEIGHIKNWAELKINDIFISDIQYILYYAEPYSYLFLDFSDAFNMFLSYIPTEVKTDKDIKILKEFVLKYGTHFPEDGFFGGRNHYDAALRIDYVNSTTENWVTRQFKFSFFYSTWNLTLGGGIFSNKSDIHVDEDFKKNADAEQFFEGGFLKYQTNSTLGEWKDSLFQLQAMTNATLTPLWELIDDPQQAAVVKKAIQNYIKNGDVWPKGTVDDRINGYDTLRSGFDHVYGKGKDKIFKFNNWVYDDDDEFMKASEIMYQKVDAELETKSNVHTKPRLFTNEWSEQYYEGATVLQSRELYEFMKRYHKNGEHKVVSNKKFHSYSLKLDHSKPLTYHKRFIKAVEELPNSYDRKEYFKFLKSFGTNYVERVDMGGEIKMSSFLKGSVSTNEHKNQFQSTLGINSYVINMPELKNSNVKSIGGSGETVNWEAFKNELNHDGKGGRTVPVKTYLKPIYDLVENKIVKENLMIAVKEYEFHYGYRMIKKALDLLN